MNCRVKLSTTMAASLTMTSRTSAHTKSMGAVGPAWASISSLARRSMASELSTPTIRHFRPASP